MGSLGRVGRHTSALVGREVKRTFSEVRRFSTGLPGLQTREADSQDFGDFDQMFVLEGGGHTPLNGERSDPVYDFT